MTLEVIALYIFTIISVFYILHIGFYLAGANLYDMWQFKRRYTRKPRGATLRDNLPLITVALAAHNEEKVIIRCIESIRKSTYPNIQILIVDDASTDHTYKLAQQYAWHHPAVNMHVIHRPKNSGKGGALTFAIKHFAKGDFVMTIDADSLLRKDAVTNALNYFDEPTVAGVAANVQIIEESSILGMLQKFEHMIGYRSKKVYALSNCEFVVGGVASMYRMSVLKSVGYYDTDTLTEDIGLSIKIVSRGNRAYKIVYAADVVAMTEPVDSFKALCRQRFRWKYGSLQNIRKYYKIIGKTNKKFSPMLTIYRLPIAIASELVLLVAPIVWGFVLYITFTQHTLALIIGAYLTITAYLLITLWFDEHTSIKDRLRLSAYAPFAYFIFYIMDIVQLYAIMRCLYKTPALLKQKNTGGAWVSPRRIGRAVGIG
jgi:cellulose synthase/poly-beta-1,6-N-acetylglucosamine synthase-like glycosyltransferase